MTSEAVDDARLPDELVKQAVDTKIRKRILPILFLGALMCYLDRTNLSFAALQMNKELKINNVQYGMGSGIFFVTYAIFGVPATIVVKRLGARIGLPLILVLWGFASGCSGLIRNVVDFYLVRLLVGATEAGFFPSVIYYLTLWFAEEDIGFSYSTVMTSTAVSGIIGAPLAGLIMHYFDGFLGIRGWRWLFIIEAIPTVFLALFMLYHLDAEPRSARFLDDDELRWLAERQQNQETLRKTKHAMKGFTQVLSLRWLWLIIFVWLLFSASYYGVIFWLPLLIQSLGVRSAIAVGFLSAIPYTCAACGMLLVAHSSDRTYERRMHLALPAFTSALGFLGCIVVHAFSGNRLPMMLFFLCIAVSGIWSMFGPYWGIPTALLTGDSAAAGFALINSVGVIGGAFGPQIVGLSTSRTGSYDLSLVIFGLMMIASGLLALLISSSDLKTKQNQVSPTSGQSQN